MRKIDEFFEKKIKLADFTVFEILFVSIMIGISLVARFSLFPIQSGDYTGFLKPWMDEIKSIGAWRSLGYEISNYPSAYMYLMSLVSGCSNTMFALKLISTACDYSAAVAVFCIISELTDSRRKAILGMVILMLCPTVIINSAYWCQCDMLYSSYLLWALYYFFKGNSRHCCIFVGIAFCFKLQAIFLLPFLIIMWLIRHVIRLRDILFIPAIYAVVQLPAIIAGRSVKDMLLFYITQSETYPWGTLNYPNIYALIDEQMPNVHYAQYISEAGIWLTLAFLGIIAFYIYTKKIKPDGVTSLMLALFTVAVTVYTLPHMHDRYGFLIDLLAIVYAVLIPKRMPVLAGLLLTSLICYMPYLIGVEIFPLKAAAVLQGALIIYIGLDLYRQIQKQTNIE